MKPHRIKIRRVLDFFEATSNLSQHRGTGNTPHEAVGHLFFQENVGSVEISFDVQHEYTHSYIIMNGRDARIL